MLHAIQRENTDLLLVIMNHLMMKPRMMMLTLVNGDVQIGGTSVSYQRPIMTRHIAIQLNFLLKIETLTLIGWQVH